MLIDVTDADKGTLKAAVELIWAKGAHNPQQAAVAFNFTQLVERLMKPAEEPKPEGQK